MYASLQFLVVHSAELRIDSRNQFPRHEVSLSIN
jgi:hypothetical protein